VGFLRLHTTAAATEEYFSALLQSYWFREMLTAIAVLTHAVLCFGCLKSCPDQLDH
jgi:hypothetical protein